jgi:hypothetical protein
MTVDIARLDHNAVATLGGANDALERLGAWVNAASQAHRLVAGLVDTAFIPDSYKPRVDPRATPAEKTAARELAIGNATAAVLQGVSLGIDPLMALQQIYIIHGRPGMYAKMMVALVLAHGHEVWTEDLSDSRAVVCGRRAGTEYVERVTITMDQARKAQWTKNEAYTKTPQDMLWSRTVAPRKRAAPAAIEATVDEEPSLDDEADAAQSERAAAEPESTVALITAAQQKKLHALLNETGRGDRDVALVWMSGVIGRELTTTKELTKREAGKVIEVLETAEPPLLDVDGDGLL